MSAQPVPADDEPLREFLDRVRAMQAVAQEGLVYTQNPFDRSRFERLRDVTAELAQMLLDGHPALPPPAVDHSPVDFSGGRPGFLVDAVQAERGYLTPKLDVRAAVLDDAGRVLMVREASDGRWTLPGGWADIGQTLSEGAVREVFEESGYVVEHERLLGIYDRERWGHPPMLHWTLKAVVLCRLLGGEATPSDETTEVAWFGRDGLPADLSRGRISAELLARVFEHVDDPSLPADV